MPSELTAFKRRVRTANRDKLLHIADELNGNLDWHVEHLWNYFICAVYEWDLDYETGIGKLRTDDELRAVLIEEYRQFLKESGVMDDDDGDVAAPARKRRRRTPSDEPEPNLFADQRDSAGSTVESNALTVTAARL